MICGKGIVIISSCSKSSTSELSITTTKLDIGPYRSKVNFVSVCVALKVSYLEVYKKMLPYYFFLKLNARRGAPGRCSPYGSRKTLALPKRKGNCSIERVEALVFVYPDFEVFKVIESGKTEAGRDFQFLEVMGTNVLTNEKRSGTFPI